MSKANSPGLVTVRWEQNSELKTSGLTVANTQSLSRLNYTWHCTAAGLLIHLAFSVWTERLVILLKSTSNRQGFHLLLPAKRIADSKKTISHLIKWRGGRDVRGKRSLPAKNRTGRPGRRTHFKLGTIADANSLRKRVGFSYKWYVKEKALTVLSF